MHVKKIDYLFYLYEGIVEGVVEGVVEGIVAKNHSNLRKLPCNVIIGFIIFALSIWV